MKIRLSKKFVFIAGGVLLLCGGSGAAAVFVGADKLLGPSYAELNGLACTTLQTDKITRDHRNWVRKYVVSDAPGDGMARIKTALRVARAVQEKEKADLVQVAVLDKAGPTARAEMRGRLIGAQVVYIPDLGKAPAGAEAKTYSAFYVDGNPTSKGEYFGLRMDLPLEDVEALSAKLTDKSDCVDPVVAAPEGEKAPAAHGDKKKPKPKGGGHGAPAEGEAASPEGGQAEEGKAAGEGHGASQGPGAEVASKESGGFLGSVTSMIFGSKEAEKPSSSSGEANGASTEGHAAPSEEMHEAPAAAPTKDAAPSAALPPGAEDQPAPAAHAAPEGEQKPVAAETSVDRPASPGVAAGAEPAKTKEGGFLSSVKSMIFGNEEAEQKPEVEQEASVEAKPSDTPPPPRTAAEGGKRWSSQDASDAVHSGDGSAAPSAPAEAATSAPPSGPNAADAAGAAWLAKFRAEQSAHDQAGDGVQPAH
jgi:hypothetical protein